jgi:integrase
MDRSSASEEEDLSFFYDKLYRRGATWYYDFTYPGDHKRSRGSLYTSDREEAARKVRDLWRRRNWQAEQAQLIAEGRISPQQAKAACGEMTLVDALAKYMEEHGDNTQSAASLRGYNRDILAALGVGTYLSTIDTASVAELTGALEKVVDRRFKDRSKLLAEESINKRIDHLAAVMRFARRSWRVNCEPDLIEWKEKKLAVPDYDRAVLADPEEAGRLFAALDADLHDPALFTLATGVRRRDGVGLMKSQVRWSERIIVFKVKSKKRDRRAGGESGKEHRVPITADIEAILTRNWDHHPTVVFTYVVKKGGRKGRRPGERRPLNMDVLRDRFDAARMKSGLTRLTWHGLRATFATWLDQEGRSLAEIQELMGHSSITMTRRYIKISERRRRAGLEALSGRLQDIVARHWHSGPPFHLKVVK